MGRYFFILGIEMGGYFSSVVHAYSGIEMGALLENVSQKVGKSRLFVFVVV